MLTEKCSNHAEMYEKEVKIFGHPWNFRNNQPWERRAAL